MHGGGPAPFAVLFELYFTGYQLFVLAGPVVDALAFAAGELDKAILRHVQRLYPISLFCANKRIIAAFLPKAPLRSSGAHLRQPSPPGSRHRPRLL